MPQPAIPHFWRHPQLPFLEGRRATGSLSCYAPHTHPSFSIGIVDAGRSVFCLAERSTAIAPGDVVLVRAGDVHSCNPELLSAWSYRMFHLDQAWLAQLLDEAPATRGLLARLPSQVLRTARAVALLDRMTAALDGAGDARSDLQAEVISCLHELMLLCAGHCRLDDDDDNDDGPATDAGLQRAHTYLGAHCQQRVELTTLAQLAGMGRYQLIRRFRARYGLTPHALQLDMRINQARGLLQEGASAAEVAYDTGFADQSHFHRTFKARVAATPQQYRARAVPPGA